MFHHDMYWSAMYSELSGHYEKVLSILSNRRSIEAFAEDEYLGVFVGSGPSQIKHWGDLSDDEKAGNLGQISGEFNAALELYRGQMIVLTYSYIEAMVKEYFVAVFTVHPNRMIRHVKESGHDTVKLFTRIINSPSKNEFIQSIAEMAANIATADGNNPAKLMTRIAEAGGADVRDPTYASLTESLVGLKKYRNRLVHEPDPSVYIPDEERALVTMGVHEALEIFAKLAICLRNLCVDNGVPVDDPNTDAKDGHLIYVDRQTRKQMLIESGYLTEEEME